MKRTLDVLVSGSLLILASPVILVVALAIRVSMGSPVLFRQARPGLGERLFTLCKFRSMSQEDPEEADSHRITPLGAWIRKTSIDELPTLWNVLKGDMSLVGPRPLLPEYLPLYSTRQARRHEVRPGVTGLAQVEGRNQLNWEDKFELDVRYVEQRSIWMDLRILTKTVSVVVLRRGVSHGEHATMPRFEGSSPSNRGAGGAPTPSVE